MKSKQVICATPPQRPSPAPPPPHPPHMHLGHHARRTRVFAGIHILRP